MFESSEVKSEVVNQTGQHLLPFGNSIINLDCVSEILRDPVAPPEYKVIFIFENGREREFQYGTRTEHSFALHWLDHCIQKNLLHLELTPESFAKWDGHRLQEINSQANRDS